MKKLEKKTILITGGNSGIGLETAKLFKAEGAQVIITARSNETCEAAKNEYGNIFDIIQADVNSLVDLDNLFSHIRTNYGKLDGLFANAGVANFMPLSEITPEHYDQVFNTNVKGLIFTVQKALPLLSQGSSVVLTSSTLNAKGSAGSTVYSATKAAVRNLARTWSAEIPVSHVRFNVISPGPIETPIWNKLGLSEVETKGFAEQIITNLPIKRFGQAEEIARVALFLASSDSSYIVGADISADGGFSQI